MIHSRMLPGFKLVFREWKYVRFHLENTDADCPRGRSVSCQSFTSITGLVDSKLIFACFRETEGDALKSRLMSDYMLLTCKRN